MSLRLFFFLLLAALLAHAGQQSAAPSAGRESDFNATVKPFLTRNCLGCHNSKLKAANFNLEPFKDAAAALAERDALDRSLRKLRNAEMPPPPIPRPPKASVDQVIGWMERQVEQYDRTHQINPGRVTARRLNREEYNNTIRDLFQTDLRPADEFPVDDSGYGFDNIGDVLSVSPVLMERYLKAAGQVVKATLELPEAPNSMTERFDADAVGRPRSLPAGPEGQSLHIRGALTVRYRFPTEADYELRVYVRRTEQECLPTGKLAVFAAGKPVEVREVDARDLRSRTFHVKVRMPAGRQEFGAAFLAAHVPLALEKDGAPNKFGRVGMFVEAIELRGPFDPAPPGMPAAHDAVFVCRPEPGAPSAGCAGRILGRFASRAWRRPVTQDELARLLRLVELAEKQGDSFENGVRLAVKAILVSPQFLFRIERDSAAEAPEGVRALNDYELASRLSYFLWSSMPDEELFRLAAAGRLRAPATLRAQVKRMLADPKAAALAENFAGQWLELRNLATVSPDSQAFPEFDEELRESMKKETTLFFDAVAREDRPIHDFLDGRFTFVNERLARHYGIPGVQGPEFRRVQLDGVTRSGILTQASVLTVTSYPTRTSPVLRGLWVLENILGVPPPPPPPNVPALEEKDLGKAVSLRQQLERHRADPACGVCHNRMDAIGFGFENYNAIGGWRTHDGSFPVDSAGALPGNKSFASSAELKKILLEQKDEFAGAFAEKLLTYALGRGLERYDRTVVSVVARKAAAAGYRFSAMIEEIVLSPPFRKRRLEGAWKTARLRPVGGKG